MKLNKEIFLKFLESPDWNNEKIHNLFERVTKENNDKIDKLEEDLVFFKDKYEEMKKLLDKAIKNYDDVLKTCEKLKTENDSIKNKSSKNNATQTYIHNIKKASIDYEICDSQKLLPPSTEITETKTISKLNLDIMWDEAKNIINDKRSYKEKNKELIILLCDFKKELVKLLGKIWYRKCVKCAEDYGKTKESDQQELHKKIIEIFQDIFENDW